MKACHPVKFKKDWKDGGTQRCNNQVQCLILNWILAHSVKNGHCLGQQLNVACTWWCHNDGRVYVCVGDTHTDLQETEKKRTKRTVSVHMCDLCVCVYVCVVGTKDIAQG